MKKSMIIAIIGGACMIGVAVWGIILLFQPNAYQKMDPLEPAIEVRFTDFGEPGSGDEEYYSFLATYSKTINENSTLYYAPEARVSNAESGITIYDSYFVKNNDRSGSRLTEKEARELLKEAD